MLTYIYVYIGVWVYVYVKLCVKNYANHVAR